MRKQLSRILGLAGLAAAFGSVGASANTAKTGMEKAKQEAEKIAAASKQADNMGYFDYPQPIFMPTKSQKIKNKINRKRLGIKK